MRCCRVCDSRWEIKVNPPRVRCGGRALMCWAESVFKSTFNTILLSSTYREVSPLWPSRGRLRCTSNNSSTWGKLTARSSTSPSRKRPKGGRQKGGQMDGGTTRLRLRGWVGGMKAQWAGSAVETDFWSCHPHYHLFLLPTPRPSHRPGVTLRWHFVTLA